MNNPKLSKKNIVLLILFGLAVISIPLTSYLTEKRTTLQQKATGGTGVLALQMIGPDGKTAFSTRQSVPVYILSGDNSSQKVYDFAVKIDATKAIVNSDSFNCTAPFKKLASKTSEWDLVCYKEGGAIVEDLQGLASFTITTGAEVGSGKVSFANVRVVGLDNSATAGVVDLTGSLGASLPFNFNVGALGFASPAISARTDVTPTPGVNKCYYKVNVNWGADQANVALTQKIMRGNTVILDEQVWCGADGTYPAGMARISPTVGNTCTGWGSSIGSNLQSSSGSVAYYKLYYKGVAVSTNGTADTQAFCGTGLVPTLTPTPTRPAECVLCATLTEVGQSCPANYPTNSGVCYFGTNGRNMTCCKAAGGLTGTLTPIPTSSPTIVMAKFKTPPLLSGTNVTPTPGVDKCYYRLNIDWGSDKAGVAITQKVVRGNAEILSEQVWCGASGTYPAGLLPVDSTRQVPESCVNWNAPNSNVNSALGSVAIYKLYYKGIEIATNGTTDTRAFCGGSTSTPIPTAGNCPNGALGNLNCSTDGKIDLYDLRIMFYDYAPDGPVPAPSTGNHSSDISPATPDGLVDEADFAKLLDNWSN